MKGTKHPIAHCPHLELILKELDLWLIFIWGKIIRKVDPNMLATVTPNLLNEISFLSYFAVLRKVAFAHLQETQLKPTLTTHYDSSQCLLRQWWDPICHTPNRPRCKAMPEIPFLPCIVKKMPCNNGEPGGQCLTQVPISLPVALISNCWDFISTRLKSWFFFIIRSLVTTGTALRLIFFLIIKK